MSFKNLIGVTRQVMVDSNQADSASGLGMKVAYGYKSKISSFVAVTAAVCDMPEYISTYSHIDSDGGLLYSEHSKIMMGGVLFLNVALDKEKNFIKPATRLSFNQQFML